MRGKKFNIASLPIRISVCDEPVDLDLLDQAMERLILHDPMFRWEKVRCDSVGSERRFDRQ